MDYQLNLADGRLTFNEGEPVCNFTLDFSQRMLDKRDYSALSFNWNNIPSVKGGKFAPIIVKAIDKEGASAIKSRGSEASESSTLSILRLPDITRVPCANAINAILYLYRLQTPSIRHCIASAFANAHEDTQETIMRLAMPLLADLTRSYDAEIDAVYYPAHDFADWEMGIALLSELLGRPIEARLLPSGVTGPLKEQIVIEQGTIRALYLSSCQPADDFMRFTLAAQHKADCRLMNISLFK